MSVREGNPAQARTTRAGWKKGGYDAWLWRKEKSKHNRSKNLLREVVFDDSHFTSSKGKEDRWCALKKKSGGEGNGCEVRAGMSRHNSQCRR